MREKELLYQSANTTRQASVDTEASATSLTTTIYVKTTYAETQTVQKGTQDPAYISAETENVN